MSKPLKDRPDHVTRLRDQGGFRNLAVAAAMSSVLIPALAHAERIVFASVSGPFQAALREAWLSPAAEAVGGVEVVEDSYTEAIFSLRAQVSTQQVSWDLVDLGSFDCVRAAQAGLLEPLDYDVIDASGIPEELQQKYWLGAHYRSYVIAWNRDSFGDDGPQNWEDFFDRERFPGKRAMWRFPVGTMEAATLGDGVAPEDMYPLDVDRAIARLEAIRPDLVWWDTGAEAERLLLEGKVDMLAAWNGRAEAAIRKGANAEMTFTDGILSFACLAIPRGAPHKDLAMKMLAQIARPEIQSRLPRIISYSGANEGVLEPGVLPPEIIATLPNAPENLPVQHRLDPAWWGENFRRANTAFDDMLMR